MGLSYANTQSIQTQTSLRGYSFPADLQILQLKHEIIENLFITNIAAYFLW